MAGDNNAGGPCTLRSIDTELEPQLAVNVTGVVAVTTFGANVNGAELLPEGTVTALGAGTTSGRELVNVTRAPPAGGEPLTSTKPAGAVPTGDRDRTQPTTPPADVAATAGRSSVAPTSTRSSAASP